MPCVLNMHHRYFLMPRNAFGCRMGKYLPGIAKEEYTYMCSVRSDL